MLKKINLKFIAESIGLISIVIGLLLVAWEIRQANHIARAEAVISIAEQWNEFNSEWFGNPEVARLVLYTMDSVEREPSRLEQSQLQGLAWHFINIFWSAHVAHENGLLSEGDISNYRSDLQWMIDYMPGLNKEFSQIYETSSYMHGIYVLEPIAALQEK